MKKTLSTLLAVCMLLSMALSLPVVAADSETVTYTENFAVSAEECKAEKMLETDQWRLEERSLNTGGYNGSIPEVKNGMLVLSKGDGIMFDWMTVPNIGDYDSTKSYVFEFDFNITSDGDDSPSGPLGGNREFYFAPGGWFNQIEAMDGKLRAGDDSNITRVAHALNTVYHAKVEWTGTTIMSTVTDPDGVVVKSGSRTNASYADMSANIAAMTHWTMRCEDGAVEIDNFSFTDGTTTFADNFDYSGSRAESMLATDYWDIESQDNTYKGDVNRVFRAPTIEDSELHLHAGESVAFTWTKLPGVGAFDTSKTYTFDFDVTVIDDGADDDLIYEAGVRELYVAPGGWFNQIEFKDGKLRAGGDGSDLGAYNLNEQYHAKIEWSNQTITSTVTDSEGNVIKSGSRTGSQYADMTANEGCMNHWIFRCDEGETVLDNFVFTDGTTTFTDSFNYESFNANDMDTFLASSLWDLETDDLPSGKNCAAPALDGGKLVLEENEAVVFNWNNIPSMPEFNATTAYTFEFDVEISESGNSSGGREFYVGPGGYYNQLEFNEGKVRTGYNTYVDFDATQPVHAKIVWKGDIITTTVYDTDGNVINTGTRINDVYTDMTAESSSMQRWVFRSEDGKAVVSNFSFTAKPLLLETQSFAVDSTQKHVLYSADITVVEGETAILSFDGGELITFADNAMKMIGKVAGSYPVGTYHVDVNLNFAQMNALVTVTLPDGGVLRRGDYNLLNGKTSASAITFSKTGECTIANEAVSYPETVARSYTLPTAPTKTDFETKAYNLTSSFDSDAKTTRSFAWTAVKDFDNMAVVYAKTDEFADSSKRITVNGVKETPEEEANQSVIYYKADITGLEAGTSYTYMIGDITDNEWGSTYTFTTEEENEKEFSFVAVSDTQSYTWEEYSYTKAAVDMALADAPDAKFLLHGGDVVHDGEQEYEWKYFFDSMKGTVETLPMFATMGNHDAWGTDSSDKAIGDLLFDLHFNHPNNGGKTALGDITPDDFTLSGLKNVVKNADETIYSFDYGNVHVVVLNSGTFYSIAEDNQLLEAQREWLENDLANSDATWTVALVHAGVYHRENTAWYCNALQDVLEDNGVDLVFNGHEHIVKRTYPMKNAKIVTKENPDVIAKGTGTVYSTIGATCTIKDHYENTIEEVMMVNGVHSSQATYTVVNVSEDELIITIKTLDGMVVDSFTIENDRMKIDDVTIGEESATAANLTSGTEATVHFHYRSETNASQPYTVMAAYYNDKKELLAAQTIASGTATESFDYTLDFTVPEIGTAKKVKFFVWNSAKDAIPLTEAFEIQ